jgi:hypothetical protein
MLHKAVGERADRDERKADERHNGFKVGKVHWCFPFFVSTKTWSINPGRPPALMCFTPGAMKTAKRWVKSFSSGAASLYRISRKLLRDHPN